MANLNEKKYLLKAYHNVERANAELSTKVGMLSKLASDILGYDVTAELCSNNEIEFRKIMPDGVSDPDSTIRLEEILKV